MEVVSASRIVNDLSARKSLCHFSNLFDSKQNTAVRQLGTAMKKRKGIIKGTYLWSKIQKRKEFTKNNSPQVVHLITSNNCIKVPIDGHT